MKKMMLGVLTCLMLLGVAGCGGKPSGMDSTVYEVGCKVADVTQSYLDAEISLEEAQDKIKMLQSRIEKEYEDLTNDSVAIEIKIISIQFTNIRIGADTAKSLEESLTKLRNKLGK